jgi:hypothetical protein
MFLIAKIITLKTDKWCFKKCTNTLRPSIRYVENLKNLHKMYLMNVPIQGGVIQSTKVALEYMGKHRGGQGGVIVHTSSRAGKVGVVGILPLPHFDDRP